MARFGFFVDQDTAASIVYAAMMDQFAATACRVCHDSFNGDIHGTVIASTAGGTEALAHRECWHSASDDQVLAILVDADR